MSERWIVPREVLIQAPANRPLRSWFPGRVVAVDQGGIHLTLAVPHESPEKRRLISRTLTREEWQRHACCAPLEEGRFVFLAVYENAPDPQGIVLILAQPSRPAHSQDELELETTLRYLRGTSA
jgi:hypothetical protein